MATDNHPLISVIMPAYNAAPWISTAIESVLQQSWQHFELIVINDGSTDDTAQQVQLFSDTRIRYYEQENKGQSAANNTGIALAKGDYIKFFDADDYMNPIHLEAQWNRIKHAPNSIASCAWGKFYDGNPASAQFIPETVWKDMRPLDWLRAALSQKRDMMGACLWLIPASLLQKAGGWNDQISLNNDFEFSIRLLLQADMVFFTPEAKIHYRSGLKGSLSKKMSRKAVESMWLTTTLGCSYLLKADSSPAMKKICANRYQDWIYQIYPNHKDMVKKMEEKIRELGGSNIAPQGGKVFILLKKILGWKTAKSVQQIFYQLGYLKNG